LGEIGIVGITLQQAPALKVTANTVSDGVRQPGQFIIGWSFNPTNP